MSNINKILGHDKILNFFNRVVSTKKLAHAYLFAGPKGIGKKLLALYLARLTNCTNKEGDLACKECNACRKIEANQHPEVAIFETDAATIKIEDIRALQKKIQYKRTEAANSFIIVDDADKMTKEASNAFLKTLEEPPKSVVIILITSNISKLPKTILSRSQVIKFGDLDNEIKIKILKDLTSCNVETGQRPVSCDSRSFKNQQSIEESLFFSGGKLQEAQNILEEDEDEYFRTMTNIFKAYKDKSFNSSLIKSLQSLARDKANFQQLLDFLIAKEEKNFREEIDSTSLKELLKIKNLHERNVNPKLLSMKLIT